MSETTTPSLAELVITQVHREFERATEERKQEVESVRRAVEGDGVVAPTRIEALNRANTEWLVWRRVNTTLLALFRAGETADMPITAEEAVSGLHRIATRELTGQGITQHASGAAADSDLYERAVWARVFHMTDEN